MQQTVSETLNELSKKDANGNVEWIERFGNYATDIEANIDTLTNFPITWYESLGFRTRKNYEITRANIAKVLTSV